MMKIFLFVVFVGLSSTNEHWFVFDQYQFQGFYTELFTLTQTEGKSLSFALSTYDRSIIVNINNQNSSEIIKLNIDRADLLYNTINHMIFVVIRDENKLETYVNCKLIDSYLFYSVILNNEKSFYKLKTLAENIEYYQTTSTNQQEIFDKYSCKQTDANNSTTTIGRSLIRKMQRVIQKVQRRKLRSRRQNSLTQSSNSFTIIYKPDIDTNTSSHIIFNIPQLKFYIEYNPNDHLFNIQFNNENHTQVLLYADKSTDRILSSNNSLIIFLHIKSTMITCYSNCELIDQEFVLDTFYMQNVIEQIMNNHNYDYNRQSTLVLFNKSIEQIAANFFCLKLDKKNQNLLPDKYAFRKFTNALDILVDTLDNPIPNDKIQNVSTVNIPLINGFGSFKLLSTNPNNEISNKMIEYDQFCSKDDDCDTNKSSMKCQLGHCICLKDYFWSSSFHRCIKCHDILIDNRCFRLSNHKSTWYEANDYCQDDEEQEYTMKLSSNLNQTDIEYLKQKFLHNNEYEHIDYMYWIGATSYFDTKKFNYRIKRTIPTTIFRWYDNNQITQFNSHDIWCSQMDYMSLTTINNNQLCISITSCGLYADDCQRNYRFLCEAV